MSTEAVTNWIANGVLPKVRYLDFRDLCSSGLACLPGLFPSAIGG